MCKSISFQNNEEFFADYLALLREISFKEHKKSIIINAGTGYGKTYTSIFKLEDIFKEQNIIISNKFYSVPRRILKENIINSPTYDNSVVKLTSINKNLNLIDFEKSTIDNIIRLDEDKFKIFCYQTFEKDFATADLDENSLLIIDEAHTIFGDSSYNEEITSRFIEFLANHYEGYIIWLTATPQLLMFNEERGTTCFNFKCLFDEVAKPRKYKFGKVDFFDSSNLKYTRGRVNQTVLEGRQVIIMLSSLNLCLEERQYYMEKGYKVAFVFSPWTKSKYNVENNKILENEANCQTIPITDLRDNETAKCIADNETIPEDVDIVIFTSYGREGYNLRSERVKLMITNLPDVVNVTQFFGRNRFNTEECIVVNNPRMAASLGQSLHTFDMLEQLEPLEKEQFYLKTQSLKKQTYLIRNPRVNEMGEVVVTYNLNTYFQNYLLLQNLWYSRLNQSLELKREYLNSLLLPLSQFNTYNLYTKQELERICNQTEIRDLIIHYLNVPFTDEIGYELIDKMVELGFTTTDGKKNISLKTTSGEHKYKKEIVMKILKKMGYAFKRKKATKKTAQEFGLEPRQDYQTIISLPTI